MTVPTLDGVTAEMVVTSRISTRVLFAGPEDAEPVVFLHGNHSSATWWEETILALPSGFRGIAPDLRGFGGADRNAKIDATRGMGDWGDDLIALLDHLGYEQCHLVGSSLGGNVAWWMVAHQSPRLRSVVLVCPGSPWGFGGTKDPDGTPCYEDFAGSGAGLIAMPFVEAIAAGDMTADTPFSPRTVFRAHTWSSPPRREDALVAACLEIHLGDDAYPGDVVSSANWPYVAPGMWGPNNAISAKYPVRPREIAAADPKPPLLWIRGADDAVVSNTSAADLGVLGPTGVLPGYPGRETFPPQPMLDQIRTTLERYRAAGGEVSELVIPDSGHVPYIDRPEIFGHVLGGWLRAHTTTEEEAT